MPQSLDAGSRLLKVPISWAPSSLNYLQESLTIFTPVTFECPCSLSSFFMPLSLAASFASSFMLCIAAFETMPVAVIV